MSTPTPPHADLVASGEARRRLRALLAERSYQRRRVVLASGRVSDFYFDSKQTVLDGEGAYLTGLLLFEAIRGLPEFPEVRAVGGLALGAVPLGTAVAVVSHQQGRPLASLVVRKTVKVHGTAAAVEGAALVPAGSTVVALEDVVTSGGSALTAVRRLREGGYQVRTVVALIDRQEGGREALEAAGLALHALFARADFEEGQAGGERGGKKTGAG